METITHREMRNRSGEILRRVDAGESFTVTNNGRPMAVIAPPPVGDVLDELIRRGEARPATSDIGTLDLIPSVTLPIGTRELLDDSRGRW
ncbi:MAG: type II toxin-antitoxin system prevent-host-death family antitoxin [Micropruina sp.]|uniref:type II toxin-antitoxin system Phd/YefM family antitoxin n=1 Tax=Micropruina sp. TaxID=2737536 RepID=UPI0039E33F09